jgi:hypothetical protein
VHGRGVVLDRMHARSPCCGRRAGPTNYPFRPLAIDMVKSLVLECWHAGSIAHRWGPPSRLARRETKSSPT